MQQTADAVEAHFSQRTLSSHFRLTFGVAKKAINQSMASIWPNWSASLMLLQLVLVSQLQPSQSGIVKDLYQKITNTNNRTERLVKQSAPICGSEIFSTPDQGGQNFHNTHGQSSSLHDRESGHSQSHRDSSSSDRYNVGHEEHRLQHQRPSEQGGYSTLERNSENSSTEDRVTSKKWDDGSYSDNSYGHSAAPIAKEFTFHVENVTLAQLERHGFDRHAPTTILMHGFTSGYPLQAWISAIVESYTLERSRSSGFRHNLFIINWNYAARGILYPRAVANIPIVASYGVRFVNELLLGEAHQDPGQIQLVGHSLGAHLAGFIGKNSREKLGKIYGLDPAGPCFGAFSGFLYPKAKRLAPGDARQVLTIQTNSDLLGIERPLGDYSVFVEGGAVQPGCPGNGGYLKSLHSLTWDGGDFDKLACSHSRAPNLLTYRLSGSLAEQADRSSDKQCQLVAYECDDWDAFTKGRCGLCETDQQQNYDYNHNHNHNHNQQQQQHHHHNRNRRSANPRQSVECIRIGLSWQYPSKQPHGHSNYESSSFGTGSGRNHESYGGSSTRRRERRASNETTSPAPEPETRGLLSSVFGRNEQTRPNEHQESPSRAKKLFLRTTDTQPYCTFHYQVILELNEPFERNSPPMSLILQDSQGRSGQDRAATLSSDKFGHKFDERTYTHLLTSAQRLGRPEQATLIFREGLTNGHRLLKSMQVNYMSHAEADTRRRLSARLCIVRTEIDRAAPIGDKQAQGSRFFFKPCDAQSGVSSQPYGSATGAQNYNDYDHQGHHSSDQQHQYGPTTTTRHPSSSYSTNNQHNQWDSNSNERSPAQHTHHNSASSRRPASSSNNNNNNNNYNNNYNYNYNNNSNAQVSSWA